MESIRRLVKIPWLSGFAVFFGLGAVFFAGVLPRTESAQPIRYNHSVHIANGMDCVDCHSGAREQERATLPGIDVCMTCHQEPITPSPEEEKIRALARSGNGIPWVQITRVPRHVYFSHRRHVTLGEMKCSECHGAMEARTVPPTQPFLPMTMDTCLDCHQTRKVADDCNDCHR